MGDSQTDDPTDRIAGAPISWGVCEVPGWGHQLPAERVLREMARIGLEATEFGPDGFLPAEPEALRRTLDGHGLTAVGGFTPLVLHRSDEDPLPGIDRLLDAYRATGSGVLVLSAATGLTGYDMRPDLDDRQWRVLLSNLDRIDRRAAEHGIVATLHPHVGTMVEREHEVQRVLDGSSIALCLDTGHLLIGGTDPLQLAELAADRIAHVHLKDVDAGAAARVRAGDVSYTHAVGQGMYRPLGAGDVDIAGIVRHLHGGGYTGWWVLEQDTVLAAEPAGDGPVTEVVESLDHLRGVLRALG